MDRARKQTDKKLHELERSISAVYSNDVSLKRIRDKYDRYMKQVKKLTNRSYLAYKKETDQDEKAKLKKVYTDEVKKLTLGSKEYKKIVSEFTSIMADVNQKALDIVNDMMPEIYMMNYNQVAVDCKKVGIKVYG